MPIIEVNGEEVEFPDDMSDADIESVLQKTHPPQESKPLVDQAVDYAKDAAPTVARQLMQGTTLGASDEIMSGLGAVGAKAYDTLSGEGVLKDRSISDLYNEGLGTENEKMRKDYKDHLALSIVANIIGGGLTGGAISKGVSAIAPKAASFLGTSTTKIGQIAKAAGINAAEGAVSGGLTADPTQGESRLERAKTGAEIGGVLGTAAGALRGVKKGEKLAEDIKSPLLQGNVDKTELGEELSQKLMSKGSVSKTAKDEAYAVADQAGEVATVKGHIANDIADSIDNSISDLDPVLVRSVPSIRKYTNELRDLAKIDGVNIKYNTLEKLRKRINDIPFAADTIRGKQAAKNAFDASMNDIFKRGVLDGDESALALINEARSKNTYWMQKFAGKEANKTIKNFIKTKGESMSPENLLDAFTRMSQIGVNNVRAAKDVLGSDAIPLLKKGFLDKINSASKNADGLDPKKLSDQIDKFMSKNKTLANMVFTPKEIADLRAVSATAKRMGKTGVVSKVLFALGKRLPFLGDTIKDLAATRTINTLSRPAEKINRPTPAISFKFGG